MTLLEAIYEANELLNDAFSAIKIRQGKEIIYNVTLQLKAGDHIEDEFVPKAVLPFFLPSVVKEEKKPLKKTRSKK